MSVTKDLIERMFAVGDVHDRRMAELAIEEQDAQAAELAQKDEEIRQWKLAVTSLKERIDRDALALAALRGQKVTK